MVVGPSVPDDPLVAVVPSLIKQLGGQALEKIARDYLDEDEEEDPEIVIEEDEIERMETEKKMTKQHEIGKSETKESEDELELLDATPKVFLTAKKKKVVKIKEQLDDSFLRRSKRVSKKLAGYKSKENASSPTEKKTPTKKISKRTKQVKKNKEVKNQVNPEEASSEPMEQLLWP